jgi:signal transduction histidine kinase
VVGIEQMAGLVDGLLDLGRLEAGIGLVQSRLRISEILISVFEEYRQPATGNGIELVMSVDHQLPTVWADASLIRLAVANYVNNAVKYAPNSGEVVLRAEVSGKQILISVQDHGPGISDKDQLRLFEKFFRVEQYGKEQIKGSGLGLSLVKSIAERHNGQAWCESRLGQGSTFYLALPIYAGDS